MFMFSCSLSLFINKMFYPLAFFFVFFSIPSYWLINFDTFFLSLNSFISIDSFSLLMIILSILIVSLCFLSFEMYQWKGNILFIFSLWFLFMSLLLFFTVTNLFLFFFFFEMSLLPTLFLILGWGKNVERIQSGFYLFYYTLFSSLPMMVSIFFFLNYSNSLNFNFLSFPLNNFLYFFFVLSFLIKMPMFLVHSWLPKAHVEAPVFGSMILAGIMLKMGGYGIFRFLFFLKFFYNFNLLWIYISLWGGLISSMICLKQSDMKCLVAYSSISHMSLVIFGLFMMNKIGILGSFYMMFAHGFCSSGLFFLVNMCYKRSGTRNMILNKGLISYFPSLSFWWFIFCVMNMGCPPSLNLIGEFFLILTCISWNYMLVYIMMISCFLSAIYNLVLFTFVNHGSLNNSYTYSNEINICEYYILTMHLFPILFFFLKLELM
nr:NADH dehydrogenase subunit 4 [Neohydatothrips samayunkur]